MPIETISNDPPKPAGSISATFPFKKSYVNVLGAGMAYVDTGTPENSDSPTVIFLHGNPTSSYLWRNVIPHVSPHARCLAPDLIAMGSSEKVAGFRSFVVEHARYLGAFLDAIVPDGNVVLVLHDWGSALGLDWARQHEARVAGLVLMEFIAPAPTWEDFSSEPGRSFFRAFRSPQGREILIDQNAFIEKVIPGGVVRPLTDEEMDQYRAPFIEIASREPIYRFPNEIPIAGEPALVYAIAEQYHAWLLASKQPKLYFWATPGSLISEEKAAWYAANLLNVRSLHIGPGTHYIQEDNPHLIGAEIAGWLPIVAASSTNAL